MFKGIVRSKYLPLGIRYQSFCRVYNCSVRCYSVLPKSDLKIREVFDDQRYFKEFSNSAGNISRLGGILESSRNSGLFCNSLLSSPRGLLDFSNQSLQKAKSLVENMILESSEKQGKVTFIRKLDQLSDLLCRVIDLAEFIRVVHPEKKWVQAAQDTHEMMFEYMNQLNTNVELYAILKEILNNEDVRSNLDEEEIQVGEYLKQDFERSGIHMDPQIRDNFVTITQQISLLGSSFSNNIHSLESHWCHVPSSELESLNIDLRNKIDEYQSSVPRNAKKSGKTAVPLAGDIPYQVLLSSPNSELRKKIWIALHNSTPDQVNTLDTILKYRAFLARMLGYKSFAHYQLEFKMAKAPENVITFLKNLQDHLLKSDKGVISELKDLNFYNETSNKDADSGNVTESIMPWDRDYLLQKKENSSVDEDRPAANISEYLSVGTIMEGISNLCESLYGIFLVPVPTGRGETWKSDQVRKLKVFSKLENRTLGYLYVDFWSPKVLPSHFTIVCSRKLNTNIHQESKEEMRNLVQLDEQEERQLPVVSLICNFSQSTKGIFSKSAPTLLTLDQVDTIFHEMGHAIHSMIGSTNLHNLSGTRCSTDFVELPSVLMEFFSKDPRIMCKIGSHYLTNEPLSEELFTKSKHREIALKECETFMQSKMALLDQVLHGEEITKDGLDNIDSTIAYHHLESELKVFPDKWSTWHAKFPHLFSYGAVYYSYLLDRSIAKKIWNELFASDPWSSEAGKKYMNSVLKWGGTKDPWLCLSEALNNKELAKGDARAMEIIAQQI